jgi:hypothetical protein
MKMIVDLDEVLMKRAFKATKLPTKTALFEEGLRFLLRREAGPPLIALSGRKSVPKLRIEKRVSIRISGKDLYLLQMRALEEGLPYGTLISSVLHKFASGALAPRQA